MNFFTKTKFLVAVIIVLSAIILAILGTIGYQVYQHERFSDDRVRETNQGGRYMAKQLQLTHEQIKEFDSLRERFHDESDKLIRDSRKVSKEIMEEIMSENPDTEKLSTLAKTFGEVQEEQKQMMIKHLLEIRSKCTVSQQANFKKLLRQIEKHEGMYRERRRNTGNKQRD